MCQVEFLSQDIFVMSKCIYDLSKFIVIDAMLINLIVLAFAILINKTESPKLTESNRDSIVTS